VSKDTVSKNTVGSGRRIRLGRFKGEFAERAAAIVEGRESPAVARDASTVVLVREAPPREVLLLKRPGTMKFAAGAYVFPGGRVDEADSDPRIGWHGTPPEEFGLKLGASPEQARALVVAAVRETYEESGILLAGNPGGQTVVPDGPEWDADRAAIREGELSFPDLLVRHGLVILADRIVPWARWITPVAEPRRYDTRFFAAIVPEGQTVDGHLAEADKIAWVAPEAGLNSARAGEIVMLPPTVATLSEFSAAGDVGDLLRQQRVITPIQPRILIEDGEAWLEVPPEVPYPL
jgi:8-oxo-dGTP pyrophosphatase MutT (NUDIX family)